MTVLNLTRRALAELLEPDRPHGLREPPTILLTRCGVCGEWLTERSHHYGQCEACEVWGVPGLRAQSGRGGAVDAQERGGQLAPRDDSRDER